MQDNRSIGKDWAKKILAEGYEADKRDTSVTYAKVWYKKTGEWNVIKLVPTKQKRTILNFKTRFIK